MLRSGGKKKFFCIFARSFASQDLGFLDNGNKQQQGLAAGSKVSLPLWLSTALFQENAIDVELPAIYNKNSCSLINADPKVVAFGPYPHWYEVGAKVTKLAMTVQERDRISKTLMMAFSQVAMRTSCNLFRSCLFLSLKRFVDIFRHAQNWREQVCTFRCCLCGFGLSLAMVH